MNELKKTKHEILEEINESLKAIVALKRLEFVMLCKPDSGFKFCKDDIKDDFIAAGFTSEDTKNHLD